MFRPPLQIKSLKHFDRAEEAGTNGEMAWRKSLLLFGGLLVAHTSPSYGWYLPGSSPRSYEAGAKVPILVNAVTPKAQADKGGSRGLVSYDYYDPRFYFCQPRGGPEAVSEGLGSALFGDRIYTSALEVRSFPLFCVIDRISLKSLNRTGGNAEK